MEIVFAASMDQVIAAAIRLDDVQVGGLLEGIEPAATIPAPDSLAATPTPSAAVPPNDDGAVAGAS
jgi:hypothetical protein